MTEVPFRYNMAKFDKNMKNDFLNSDDFFDEEELFEEEYDKEYEGFDETEFDEEFPETEEESEISDEDDYVVEEEAKEVMVAEAKSGSDKARWYVVHTYSGHENKVKANIEKIVENRGMQDLIQRVEMPTEDVVEVKNGQRKVRTRKMFPGYVIVKMIITSESWYLIRNTQGVTGFVGHGSDPIPLTDEEVRHMGIEKVSFIIDVEPGDTVKVTDGPFDNFMGVVEDVNMEKQTLKVRISMFGRETPVELEFGQVEKIS